MLYELREYVIAPNRMEECHDIFREVLVPLFEAHGMRVVGLWEPHERDGRTFLYLLAYPDAAAREKAWNGLRQDPEWMKKKTELGETPPWESDSSRVLSPTKYSPLP